MEERKIESLDEAIDELLSLGYLQYVEPEGCSVEVTEADRRIEPETQNIGEKECCEQNEEQDV